jgi:hypothetical protein
MNRMVLVVALVLTATAGFMGCDDDDCIVGPVVYGGRIEGQVSDGEPIDMSATVRYKSLPGVMPEFRISSEVDTTGYFQMIVPPGKGYLYLSVDKSVRTYYSTRGLSTDEALADTLDVVSGIVQADFKLGRAQVDVELPRLLAGVRARYALRSDVDIHQNSRYITPRDGVASLQYRMLPPETFDVEVDLDVVDYKVLLSYMPGQENRALLNIEPGLKDQVTVTIPSPSILKGRVSGSWQILGGSPPRISLFFGDEQYDSVYFDTEEDGTFTFFDYQKRPIRVLVYSGLIDHWVGGNNRESATVFDMSNGQDLSFEYVENGFRYDLIYPGDTSSIHAIPRLFDEQGTILYQASRWSWGAGCLSRRFSNLDPGRYYLWLEPCSDSAQWLPQFYDGATSLTDATPIVVGDGGSVTYISIPLIDGGIISGVLTDETGTPFPEDSLEFYLYTDDPDFSTVWNIDTWHYDEASGFYEVYRLEDGDYNIGVSVNDGSIGWYPDGQVVMDATLITIIDHVVIEDADWQIPSTP